MDTSEQERDKRLAAIEAKLNMVRGKCSLCGFGHYDPDHVCNDTWVYPDLPNADGRTLMVEVRYLLMENERLRTEEAKLRSALFRAQCEIEGLAGETPNKVAVSIGEMLRSKNPEEPKS